MSEAKLKPCPLCGSTNIRMLEPELLDTDAWNCAIECLDCRVHIGPSYCEPDPLTARYSAQVDWNRRPSAKAPADEREQFLMANLLAALEVALGNVAALAIVDRVRQVADRIYPTSNLSLFRRPGSMYRPSAGARSPSKASIPATTTLALARSPWQPAATRSMPAASAPTGRAAFGMALHCSGPGTKSGGSLSRRAKTWYAPALWC